MKDPADDEQWVCALLAGGMTLLVIDLVKDWQTPKAIYPESVSWMAAMLHADMHPFS